MEKKEWKYGEHKYELVRISSVPGFRDWLDGQTIPLIEQAEDPFDWAYLHDYERFNAGLQPID